MPTLFRKKPAPVAAGASKTMPRRVGSSSAQVAPTYVVPGYPGAAATATHAEKGQRFRYPTRFWLPLRLVGYALILLSVLNLVNTMTRFVQLLSNFSVYSVLLLITAFASLLFSVVAGALIADALPTLEVRSDGLAVTEFVRWRTLPWQRIVKLHSMALPGERYVVFVQYAGAPLSPEHIVYSLLAGLGAKSGFFYTSDIKDFDDLTRLILDARMRAVPGTRVEDLLVEDVPMPVVQMAFNPMGTLTKVAGFTEGEVSSPLMNLEERPTIPRSQLIRMQLGITLVPVILFLIDNLVNGGIPILTNSTGSLVLGIFGLLAIGLLELPFVALAIQAVGETVLGHGEFQVALNTYPYLELPRMLGFVVIFALIAIKAPFILVFLVWLGALAWTTYLTLLFTQRLYRITQNQAIMAGGAAAIVQFFVLIAYMMLRAPGLA